MGDTKLKVKVCGMRDPGNLVKICALNPDYLGFIFYEKSPRYLSDYSLDFFQEIPSSIEKVAVFVNESVGKMLKICASAGINYIQLHGKETPATCRILKNNGMKLIKTIPSNSINEAGFLAKYESVCDYFLFDTVTADFGGSGEKFDWADLMKTEISKPFFLSGGITEEDYKEILNLSIPNLFGVDINSRFEISPGLKDSEKVELFINGLRDEKGE